MFLKGEIMGIKKSFIFYYDWWDIFEPLSDEQKGVLISKIFSYVKEGEETDIDDLALKISFNVIRNTINRDVEKYEKICIERTKNAKKGALKRWGNDENETNNEIAEKEKSKVNMPNAAKCYQMVPNDTDNDNDNDNDTDNVNDNDNDNVNDNNISFSAKTARVYSEDFLLFWKEYPKKVGKGEAYKQWKKAKLTCDEKTEIINALKWQKKSYNWCNSNGRFIPNPSTYISQRRWEDEPDLNLDNDITDPNRYTDGDILPDYIMRGDY